MTKALVKVEGTNENFCSIIFVHNLFINGVQRESFPRNFRWLIKELQRKKRHHPQSKLPIEVQASIKQLNLLSLNANNLHHAVKEIYSYPGEFYFGGVPNEINYLSRFSRMIEALPRHFVEEGEYEIDCRYFQNVDSIKIGITKVRESAISYLSQKYEKRFEREVELLKRLGQSTESIDFDKYIDDWVRRLMGEVQ